MKNTYNFVKNYIKNEGYTLLSTEYKNNKTKLNIKCDKCHEYEVKFNDFQQGRRCPECKGLKKLTFNKVKKYIESQNYKLLSNDYINNSKKLKICCPKGHEYESTYNNFQRGYRCSVCAKNKNLTYDEVKRYIENEGYKLLSDKYIKNSEKLKFRCPKNHSFKMSYNNFQRGQRCPVCNLSNMVSKGEKEVLGFVKSLYPGNIIENDRSIIKNKKTKFYLELDMYLKDINKAIEYNGEYWHSKRSETDRIKLNECKKLGINLLVITDKEWLNDQKSCKNNIRNFIYEN